MDAIIEQVLTDTLRGIARNAPSAWANGPGALAAERFWSKIGERWRKKRELARRDKRSRDDDVDLDSLPGDVLLLLSVALSQPQGSMERVALADRPLADLVEANVRQGRIKNLEGTLGAIAGLLADFDSVRGETNDAEFSTTEAQRQSYEMASAMARPLLNCMGLGASALSDMLGVTDVVRSRQNANPPFLQLASSYGVQLVRLQDIYASPNVQRADGVVDRADLSVASGVAAVRQVILGERGAGKSTYLAALAHAALRDGNRLPITWQCRDLEEDFELYSLVRQSLESTYPDETLDDEQLTAALHLGRFVLMFDGLDEVLDDRRRRHIRDGIQRTAEQYPFASVVVSCRTFGYENAAFSPLFHKYTLCELSEQDVRGIARRFFETVGADEGDLALFLRQSSAQADLRRNPLMLGLLLLVFRRTRRVPVHRLALFEECTDLVLHEWDERRGIDLRPEVAEVEAYLRPVAEDLAFAAMSTGVPQLQVREIAESSQVLARWLPQTVERTSVAEKVARHLLDRASILDNVGRDEAGRRVVRFTHRSFSEFLASSYAMKNLEDDELLELIERLVADSSLAGLAELLIQHTYTRPSLGDRSFQRLQASGERGERLAGRSLAFVVPGAAEIRDYLTARLVDAQATEDYGFVSLIAASRVESFEIAKRELCAAIDAAGPDDQDLIVFIKTLSSSAPTSYAEDRKALVGDRKAQLIQLLVRECGRTRDVVSHASPGRTVVFTLLGACSVRSAIERYGPDILFTLQSEPVVEDRSIAQAYLRRLSPMDGPCSGQGSSATASRIADALQMGVKPTEDAAAAAGPTAESTGELLDDCKHSDLQTIVGMALLAAVVDVQVAVGAIARADARSRWIGYLAGVPCLSRFAYRQDPTDYLQSLQGRLDSGLPQRLAEFGSANSSFVRW